jgi:hypothetical protein
MTTQEKPYINVEKPAVSSADFVDFEIEKEGWDVFRMADKTMLKIRFVLLRVLMDKTMEEIRVAVKNLPPDQPLKIGLGFTSQNLFSVEPPKNLRGQPDDKRYSIEDLRGSTTEEDIDYETVRSNWNIYVLKNGMKLKARISPTVVSKTSRFDNMGMPIYIIDFLIDMVVMMPEDVERILKQRRRTI